MKGHFAEKWLVRLEHKLLSEVNGFKSASGGLYILTGMPSTALLLSFSVTNSWLDVEYAAVAGRYQLKIDI